MKEKTQDEKTGLLYHAYDSSRKESWSDPVTGRSSEFWGRSIGWVPVALLNDLDFILENHPKRKELEDFVASLMSVFSGDCKGRAKRPAFQGISCLRKEGLRSSNQFIKMGRWKSSRR